MPTMVCFVQLAFLCIAGRHLKPASFSMLSLVNWLVVDRRQQCHVLVVRILCMRTLNRRGCVQLLYSSEILGPKCALKKRAHACSFFKRTQKTRAKEAHYYVWSSLLFYHLFNFLFLKTLHFILYLAFLHRYQRYFTGDLPLTFWEFSILTHANSLWHHWEYHPKGLRIALLIDIL